MKLLFKLYLLGQLIAAPFMVSAISQAFDSPDNVSPPDAPSSVSIAQYQHDLLCESAEGPALNPVLDTVQQTRLIADSLFNEDLFSTECPAPTPIAVAGR